MATFAEKLFDFAQRRQTMALNQQKYAEAKREFNINTQLNEIQQQQNSRRLDLLEIFNNAKIVDDSEARKIQREGIQLTNDAQEENKRQAREAEMFKVKEALQSGRFIQGQGEGASGLVPVDSTVLGQEAQDRRISDVFNFADKLQEKYGIKKKEALAGALNFPALIQQPTSRSSGFSAAIGKLKVEQETASALGQVQALAGQGSVPFDKLSVEEIGKLTDQVIERNKDKLNQALAGTSIDPSAAIRSNVINTVISNRANIAYREAQTSRALIDNSYAGRVKELIRLQKLLNENELNRPAPGLLK